MLINTSNKGKLAEYKQYLPDLQATCIDLDEPEADPITIICYKASQFGGRGVIVDDVSLDVRDTPDSMGSNIRWRMDKLLDCVGNKAVFVCLIGVQKGDKVCVYEGQVVGTIVKPRGDGFGFGPYFLPDGALKTLGEYMDPQFNARYIAIQNLLADRPIAVLDPIINWLGGFQNQCEIH